MVAQLRRQHYTATAASAETNWLAVAATASLMVGLVVAHSHGSMDRQSDTNAEEPSMAVEAVARLRATPVRMLSPLP